MNYNKLKKGLCSALIILCITLSYAPTTPAKTLQNRPQTTLLQHNTWIVDDDSDGDFTSIQEAIDNNSVANGDTILVYNGTYQGDIHITKQLNIQGMETEYPPYGNPTPPPLIQGDWYNSAVTLSAPTVVLTGFTITGGTFNGIQISSNMNKNTIKDNTIQNSNGVGIYISDSSCNNKIQDNLILNNKDHGIRLRFSDNNTISGNTIINHNYSAIYLYHYCRNNTINNNKITDFHIGLFVEEYSHDSNIYWNNISNGNLGILIEESNGIIITQNTLRDCSISLAQCEDTQIYYNNFFNVQEWESRGFFYDSLIHWLCNYWDRPRFMHLIPGTWTFPLNDRKIPNLEIPSALKPFKIPV